MLESSFLLSLGNELLLLSVLQCLVVLGMGEMIPDDLISAGDFLFKQMHVTIINDIKINTVHAITPIIKAKTVD